MRSLRSHRPSPALVISVVALFVALGGTGYAATQLPRNSVGARQIKANAVSAAKVKNGSLTVKDFKRGQMPAGARGSQGPAGPSGAPGRKGTDGRNGTNGAAGSALAYAHVVLTGTTLSLDTANSKNIAAANVSRGATGLYCFSNLSFNPHNVVGNTDAAGASGIGYAFNMSATLGTSGFCPTHTQAYAIVDNPNDGSANADSSFYIAFN